MAISRIFYDFSNRLYGSRARAGLLILSILSEKSRRRRLSSSTFGLQESFVLSQCQAILQSYPEKLHLTYKRRYRIVPSPKSEFYDLYPKH